MSWEFYNCRINPTHALPRVRLNEVVRKLFSIIGLIIWASLVMGIVNLSLMTLRILLMFREFISPMVHGVFITSVIVLAHFWGSPESGSLIAYNPLKCGLGCTKYKLN